MTSEDLSFKYLVLQRSQTTDYPPNLQEYRITILRDRNRLQNARPLPFLRVYSCCGKVFPETLPYNRPVEGCINKVWYFTIEFLHRQKDFRRVIVCVSRQALILNIRQIILCFACVHGISLYGCIHCLYRQVSLFVPYGTDYARPRSGVLPSSFMTLCISRTT
jgi:hypothetical protein